MKKTTMLCVMAMLCPKKKQIFWLMPLFYLALGLLLINVNSTKAKSQTLPRNIKALQVGDMLPESFWQQEFLVYDKGKTSSKTLAAYRDRLLILDFWGTWCSSCFHKLPFLDSIASKAPQKIGVVMVNTLQTRDDLPKIKSSLSRYQTENKLGLATIYNDSYLLQSFPHQMVPYYVWISKEGRVLAITGSDFVNPASVTLSIRRFDKS